MIFYRYSSALKGISMAETSSSVGLWYLFQDLVLTKELEECLRARNYFETPDELEQRYVFVLLTEELCNLH